MIASQESTSVGRSPNPSKSDGIRVLLILLQSRYIALEHENEQWRQQLQTSQQLNPDSVPIALSTATTELVVPAVLKSDAQLDDSQGLSLAYPQYHLAPAGSTPGSMMGGNDPTKPRSLKTVTVTGPEIDDLYQLYMFLKASYQHGSNIFQVLPPLCLIPPDPRCADQAQCVLRAVSVPVLGRHRRLPSVILPKPDFAHGTGQGGHRNGPSVSLVDVRAMVHHTGTVAPADMAVSKGESPRCDISSEWNAFTCSDAAWFPYPDVEP